MSTFQTKDLFFLLWPEGINLSQTHSSITLLGSQPKAKATIPELKVYTHDRNIRLYGPEDFQWLWQHHRKIFYGRGAVLLGDAKEVGDQFEDIVVVYDGHQVRGTLGIHESIPPNWRIVGKQQVRRHPRAA